VSLFGGVLSRGWTRPSEAFLAAMSDGTPSITGANVSERTALGIPTFWACVNRVAGSVAMCRCVLREASDDGHKPEAKTHPLYSLLRYLPNPELTAIEMFRAMQGHLLLWGNAYAEIQRDGMGRMVGLWPLRPDSMQSLRNAAGERVWLYRLPNGQDVRWTWQNAERRPSPILHVRGLGWDGYSGYSVLTYQRDALGLAMAANDHAGRVFANGSMPRGVLQAPGDLTEPQAKRLKESWEAAHRGLTQANRVAVLERGITWQATGATPHDAQLLESRAFSDLQIAAMFGVPPHLVGIVDKSTSWGTGIEQQNIAYVTHTIKPWLDEWEQAIMRDLFGLQQWDRYVVEFDTDVLQRGDLQSRITAYASAIQNGIMSPDEVRAKEGMGPRKDGSGTHYWRPANMIEEGEDGDESTATDGQPDGESVDAESLRDPAL
jgi:HK97 family phage portal protein